MSQVLENGCATSGVAQPPRPIDKTLLARPMRHRRGELEGFWKAAPLDRRREDAEALPKFGKALAGPTVMRAATNSVAERKRAIS